MAVRTQTPAPSRRRDAAQTRHALLESAADLFARHGYAATTVRDIADGAGANVALINRYFGSKEGLFEACLDAAVRSRRASSGEVHDLAQLAEVMSRHVAGASANEDPDREVLLLLRSSGDERSERMRIGVLQDKAERMASLAGWTAADPDDDVLLRAQLVMAVSIGMAVLRPLPGFEPLASADQDSLIGPVRATVEALLGSRPARAEG